MKSNAVLLSTWVGSDMRRARIVILVAMMAMSLIGVGIVGAGGMGGGPDIPKP